MVAADTVGEDAEPRFLEDEGFYVGVKPYVADKNKNKMECRLLKEAETAKQVCHDLKDCLILLLHDNLWLF